MTPEIIVGLLICLLFVFAATGLVALLWFLTRREAEDLQSATKQLIADLRGGIPSACDFCNQTMQPEEAAPEEAGQWACPECQKRFAEEDAAFGSPTHHRL